MLNEVKHLGLGQLGHRRGDGPYRPGGRILRFAQDDRRGSVKDDRRGSVKDDKKESVKDGKKGSVKDGILRFLFLTLLTLTGCSDRGMEGGGAEIAVTNSYLQCVVQDLCGPETEVMCLAPPGMCPGHFDIAPASVKALRNCRMLLLFDFQQKVEATLARLKADGLETFRVTDVANLCVPETYLSACRQVAEFLSIQIPERAGDFEASLTAVERRMDRLGRELQDAVEESGAASAPILASNHQAVFSQRLGLETVATFVGSDTETIANIDHCLKQTAGRDIRFVIANQQEGTLLAKALAERLDAKAVIFSNFPLEQTESEGFDQLLRHNVSLLIEASGR